MEKHRLPWWPTGGFVSENGLLCFGILGYVSPAKRSASPGRALQDVKLMLSEYTRRKGVEREGAGLLIWDRNMWSRVRVIYARADACSAYFDY